MTEKKPQAGALEYESPMMDAGLRIAESVKAEGLFNYEKFIETWQQKLRDAGVPEDLGHMSIGELDTLIAESLGRYPTPDDATDLDASEAWAMSVFARWNHGLRRFSQDGEPKLVAHYAFLIGRLAEWWRWRSHGHDHGALMHQKRRIDAGGGGRERAKRIREDRGLEDLYRDIDGRLSNGAQLGPITKTIVKEGRYQGRADSLARTYRRWKKGK